MPAGADAASWPRQSGHERQHAGAVCQGFRTWRWVTSASTIAGTASLIGFLTVAVAGDTVLAEAHYEDELADGE